MLNIGGWRVAFRKGTMMEWLESNPVLKKYEPGCTTDTLIVKIGDGVTPWKDLPYASSEDMARIMAEGKML